MPDATYCDPSFPSDDLKRTLTVSQTNTDRTLMHLGVVGDTYNPAGLGSRTEGRFVVRHAYPSQRWSWVTPARLCSIRRSKAFAKEVASTSPYVIAQNCLTTRVPDSRRTPQWSMREPRVVRSLLIGQPASRPTSSLMQTTSAEPQR